jgi:hypothetical protein
MIKGVKSVDLGYRHEVGFAWFTTIRLRGAKMLSPLSMCKTIGLVGSMFFFGSVACDSGSERPGNSATSNMTATSVSPSPNANQNNSNEPGTLARPISMGTHKLECHCSCNTRNGANQETQTIDATFETACSKGNGTECQNSKTKEYGKLAGCKKVAVPSSALIGIGSDNPTVLDPSGGDGPAPTNSPRLSLPTPTTNRTQ